MGHIFVADGYTSACLILHERGMSIVQGRVSPPETRTKAWFSFGCRIGGKNWMESFNMAKGTKMIKLV